MSYQKNRSILVNTNTYYPIFTTYTIIENTADQLSDFALPLTFEKHLGRFYVQKVTWKTISYTGGGADRSFRMRDSINTTRDVYTASTWTSPATVGSYNLPTGYGVDSWFNPGASPWVRDISASGTSSATLHVTSISITGYYLGG